VGDVVDIRVRKAERAVIEAAKRRRAAYVELAVSGGICRKFTKSPSELETLERHALHCDCELAQALDALDDVERFSRGS
jgi:hypothetical protein